MATFEVDARLDDLDLDDLEALRDDLTDAPTTSALAILGARIAAVAGAGSHTFPVGEGIKVTYSTDIKPSELAKINRRCTDKRGNIDTDRSTALLLAAKCQTITVDGDVVSLDGRVLTFGSKDLQEQLDASDSVDAVRALYGGPKREYGFKIMSHHNELLELAGLGERTEEGDDSTPS